MILKFAQLRPSERYLLIETFLLLNLIRLSFLGIKFSLLQKLLQTLEQTRAGKPSYSDLSLDRIIWAVNVSTHFSPGGAKCLARALVTQVMMKRQQLKPELKIGVIKGSQNRFQAHAWIEYGGQVVIGNLPDLDDFKVLLSSQDLYYPLHGKGF